jgi:hypothetical protein
MTCSQRAKYLPLMHTLIPFLIVCNREKLNTCWKEKRLEEVAQKHWALCMTNVQLNKASLKTEKYTKKV